MEPASIARSMKCLASLRRSPRYLIASPTRFGTPISRPLESLVREGVRFGRRRRPLLQLIMRTLVETGELEEPWRERALVPFLETTSALLAAQLGRPVVELRMAIQDNNATPQQERAAVTLYEDHLVRVAQNLVLES